MFSFWALSAVLRSVFVDLGLSLTLRVRLVLFDVNCVGVDVGVCVVRVLTSEIFLNTSEIRDCFPMVTMIHSRQPLEMG